MPDTNKIHVRKQVDDIKADFDKLRLEGKISGEVLALMTSMLLIIDLILAIFMERTTKKGNNNSSIPSSQAGKKDDTAGNAGTHGKGNQARARSTKNQRTIETVTVVPVTTCANCGADLTDTPCCGVERRTKIDIVFEQVIEHVDAEIKECNVCRQKTKGEFPADMPGNLQYGDGIKALVVNLIVCQMVALGRAAQLVQSMIGRLISEATMLQYVIRLYEALADWEQKAIKEVMASKVIHTDETSMRVDKKNYWIHVYSSGDITLKFLHRNRGKKAMEEIGIIPKYGGTIVHDCWSSYLSYKNCKHGLCGAHLVRELAFVVESNGYGWARNMKKLLLKTRQEVADSPNKCLDDKQYARLQKHYRNLLTRGKKEMPSIPPKQPGKRGKMPKSDAHNLWERFRDYEASVLLFAKDPLVPFTNNRSERDLRMAKVKQKVSGCFRKEIFAKAYCRISSYLQTQTNKGIAPMTAIQMALRGEA